MCASTIWHLANVVPIPRFFFLPAVYKVDSLWDGVLLSTALQTQLCITTTPTTLGWLTFLLILSSGGMTFGTKYFDEMLLFVKAITLHFSTTDCILLCNVFAKYLLTKCDCSRSQKFCATIATEILNPIGVTVAAPQKRALIHSNFDLFFNFPS